MTVSGKRYTENGERKTVNSKRFLVDVIPGRPAWRGAGIHKGEMLGMITSPQRAVTFIFVG